MELGDVLNTAVVPALKLLPGNMGGDKPAVMLLAIGLQESRFEHRFQVVQGKPGAKGPARGFWQFERGTRASRGGVWGVYLHQASRGHLATLCTARGVRFEPDAIYAAIETDDVLAAGVARLLLWTDPKALPVVGNNDAAWNLYLRTWRPGKPHPATWGKLCDKAAFAVMKFKAAA